MIRKTVAHYQLAEKLGAGDMGEVFRAKDTKLGRDVALELLSVNLTVVQNCFKEIENRGN